MTSTRKLARLAGLTYLLISLPGFYGLAYVPLKTIVRGDAGRGAGACARARAAIVAARHGREGPTAAGLSRAASSAPSDVPITGEVPDPPRRHAGDSMATNITVNGVQYDSADAMPPDVRQIYELSLANLPDLADRDGDGVPDIVQSGGATMMGKTIVRQKFVINGQSYDSKEAMPPDVRQAYDTAMSALNSGNPNLKKNEVKLSFSVTGPGLHFSRTLGGPKAPLQLGENPGAGSSAPLAAKVLMMPSPIEPSKSGVAVRIVTSLGLGAIIVLAVWLWSLTR